MIQSVENTISFTQQAPKVAHRRIELIPRTRNQERLVLALQDESQHIVVTVGPAGGLGEGGKQSMVKA
jgi:16S rRNA U1498 N3-methylase RsmE